MIALYCYEIVELTWMFLVSPDDKIGDLKLLIAAQTGTRAEKIRLQKGNNIFKDHITLEDCTSFYSALCCIKLTIWNPSDEIHDGMNLELYYN